jgi:hypothetical protein
MSIIILFGHELPKLNTTDHRFSKKQKSGSQFVERRVSRVGVLLIRKRKKMVQIMRWTKDFWNYDKIEIIRYYFTIRRYIFQDPWKILIQILISNDSHFKVSRYRFWFFNQVNVNFTAPFRYPPQCGTVGYVFICIAICIRRIFTCVTLQQNDYSNQEITLKRR